MYRTLGNIRLLLLLLIGAFCTTVNAQEELDRLRINSIELDEEYGTVNVGVSIPMQQKQSFNSTNARFYEYIDDQECPMQWIDFSLEENDQIQKDTFSVLFLLDWSGSMNRNERLINSKKAIRESINRINLSSGSKFFFSAFHNDVFNSQEVSKSNIDLVLDAITRPKPTYDTDLFRAVIEKTRELTNYRGKKILVLLSDGENDIKRNPYYTKLKNAPYDSLDVFDTLREVDAENDLLVFPIGLGAGSDVKFLKKLVAITKDSTDQFIYSENAAELADIIHGLLSSFQNDYVVRLKPSCDIYKGEDRELTVSWTALGEGLKLAHKNYARGTAQMPIMLENVVEEANWIYWLKLFVIGAVILGLLLVGLMYLVPLIKKRDFKRKFVTKYVPEANKIKRDPITQDPFEEGDEVVTKCRQMTSLETWNALGHCPSYPSCMEFNDPCPGTGGEDIQGSFFSQQGTFRILNWLWFGGVGGFVGWIFYAANKLFNFTWLENILASMTSSESMQNKIAGLKGGENFLDNIPKIADQALLGFFLGASLIALLTIVEERGQTRKFSIKRILIRTLIGLLVCFIIFFSGAIVQFLLLNKPFLIGIINWIFFGISFGAILSINSSVELKRGIFGGVISALIAGLIYHGMVELIPDDGLAKLLSFLTLGAILGALVVTVLATLEDFELVYLSPSEYAGMVKPISKWLKKGMEIFIGTSSKCYVFIKWDDEYAEEKHAKLIYQQGVVSIIPLHETLVNGVIIPENQKLPLQNNDIIQLGRYSNSKMQYKERRTTT